MRCSRLLPVLLLMAVGSSSHAEHLGVIGPTYPIAEESAIDMLMRKMQEKEKSGELKQLQEEGIRRSLNSVRNMRPVPGIVTATERSYRLIDPTVTYAQPIATDDGRIVAPAGTRVNPLDTITLSKTLVFFNGNDPVQREAVRKLVAKGRNRVKPILVAGSWLDMSKAWHTQVYFDQQGLLSRRFGIRVVPTVLRQQGSFIRLDEIPAKELQ